MKPSNDLRDYPRVELLFPSNFLAAIDLKGGKGVQVDAEENHQGTMYASGAAEELDLAA